MTMANPAAERSGTNGMSFIGLRVHPLTAILVLAAAIRLPLAFWPNFHHPDEIFQYLEPAWRLLGHDSIISWEWRYGMRSWLLPTVMAGPVAIGDWLAPGGTGAFLLPRLLVALASLSIVASAWAFGERIPAPMPSSPVWSRRSGSNSHISRRIRWASRSRPRQSCRRHCC